MLLKFLRDNRGNILPTFALIVVPLLVSTGAVVDYTNAYDQRSLVQDALDSAALAAGKQVGVMDTEELEAEAESFYLANIGVGKITNVPTIQTEIDGTTVDVNTTLHVPTYFLGMIGLDEFVFDLRAQVTIAMGTIEVAMVLDNSTSMASCTPSPCDAKIAALRTAASALATTLYGLGATSTKPEPVKIALAPFAASVNVGPGATFVDTLGRATYAGDAQKGEGAAASLNPFDYFSTLLNADGSAVTWGGCVQERPIPFDVSDDAPSTEANPTADEAKTLFLPMFAPDEADPWTCSTTTCSYAGTGSSSRRYNGATSGNKSYNNYLPDGGDTLTCGGVSASKTFTVTKANPGVFTRNGHGLANFTNIVFNTTGALYGGLTAGQSYYVAPGSTANTFRVSTTSSAVNLTSITVASPAVFTKSSHGLSAGTAVTFQTGGSLPSPLTAGTTYYVISSGLSTDSFRVSTTSGGSAINTSGSQSGTHSYVRLVSTNSGSQSGTHSYVLNTQAANFTCQSGDDDCGTAGHGKSEEKALAGINISTDQQCKYGTVANKATIADITISSMEGGPNYMCTTQAVTPLTATEATVVDNITAQQAYGYTNITAGIMWGLRLLSPTEPFTQGRAYTNNENDKIMIVMTDGENTYFPYVPGSSPSTYNNKFLKSGFGAWGYIYKSHLGINTTNSTTIFTTLNARTALACQEAKDANIQVYTIAFQVTDAPTLAMLTACASDQSMAYQSGSNEQLIADFAAIGDDISLLRIAQ